LPLFLQAEIVDQIVAIVDDGIITQSDYNEYRQKLKAGKIQDDLFQIDAKELLASRERLLQQLVDEKILENEIKRNNLEVTKEAVEEEIQKILRRNQINKAQLKEALKSEGTNYTDYYDFIKKRLERQKIIQQSVTSKVRISDDDVEQYYLKKFGKDMDNSFEYSLSHILVGSKKEAESVYQALIGGQDFVAAANQYSKDNNYSSGGFLGKFKSGEMSTAIEKAVKSLDAGEFSGPVKTAAGFHIFKVNEKKLIPNVDLTEKTPEIRALLSRQAMKEQFQFWLEQKRKESYIRINVK